MKQETKQKLKETTKKAVSSTAKGMFSALKFVGTTTRDGFKALNEEKTTPIRTIKPKKQQAKQLPGWNW